MKLVQIIGFGGWIISLSSCTFLQGVQSYVLAENKKGSKPLLATTPASAQVQKSQSLERTISKNPIPETPETDPFIPYTPDSITNIPAISPELLYEQQFKYAILLNVPVEKMLNHNFIEFMEYWLGTRYRMGGHDTTGIDCSSFARTYMKHFYQQELPRSSAEQFDASTRIDKSDLKEGDLVFFYTTHRKRVSHVGVYVGNNKFAHASTSLGVIISDLDEPYYLKRFAGAGRLNVRR